jgi:hypothetical protein
VFRVRLVGACRNIIAKKECCQLNITFYQEHLRLDSPCVLRNISYAMSELVTIASGLGLQEAYLARARLAGSGISCFFANEHLMRVRHVYAVAAGGVELRVMRHDVPTAMEVLTGRPFDEAHAPDAFAEPCCPQCGSTRHTRRSTRRWRDWLHGILALLVVADCPPLPRDRKTCKQCGHVWI